MLMKLHTYGLLRNSFRPTAEIRHMRTYCGSATIWCRGQSHIQRMQKADADERSVAKC